MTDTEQTESILSSGSLATESAAALQSPISGAGARITQLDLLRGFIMVVMAIDHVAFFVAKRHPSEMWSEALPTYPSFISFFTREITHLAAPGFFLLMGAGIALFHLSRTRLGWSQARIAKYFITRGFLLLVINQFLENPAFFAGFMGADPSAFWPPLVASPDTGAVFIATGVLTALGISMMIAGLLTRLPSAILLAIGAMTIVASQIFTPDITHATDQYSILMRFLTVPGLASPFFVLYSFLPWLGVTLCGMVLGRRARSNPDTLTSTGLITGALLLILFVAMRFAGIGDHHAVPSSSIIDFFNVTKYPPSMAFLAVTLGINLLMLSALPRLPKLAQGILDVYGKSPLFFYLAHLWLFMLIGLPFRMGTGYGILYLVWVLAMIPLYFACKRYTAFKLSKPPESYWRFF